MSNIDFEGTLWKVVPFAIGVVCIMVLINLTANYRIVNGKLKDGVYLDYTIDSYKDFNFDLFMEEVSQKVGISEDKIRILDFHTEFSKSSLGEYEWEKENYSHTSIIESGSYLELDILRVLGDDYVSVFLYGEKDENKYDLYEIDLRDGRFFLWRKEKDVSAYTEKSWKLTLREIYNDLLSVDYKSLEEKIGPLDKLDYLSVSFGVCGAFLEEADHVFLLKDEKMIYVEEENLDKYIGRHNITFHTRKKNSKFKTVVIGGD